MEKGLPQIVQEVVEETCDKYCKWPEKYQEQYGDPDEAGEKMMDEICVNCPLNRLV